MGKHLFGALDNVLCLLILLDSFLFLDFVLDCFAAPDSTLRRVDGSEGYYGTEACF